MARQGTLQRRATGVELAQKAHVVLRFLHQIYAKMKRYFDVLLAAHTLSILYLLVILPCILHCCARVEKEALLRYGGESHGLE